MTSLSIDRSSLDLEPLVIASYPEVGGYWLHEDGLTEPEFAERATFADESPDVPGALLLQSVTGLGTLALPIVYTLATDGAALKAQKRALEAAVRQFTYTVDLTIVGAVDAYQAVAGNISWGAVDSGMLRANLARCVVTIPVQPLGA